MLKDVLQGKPFRHPLHPFLVHFPVGFFVLSFLIDIMGWLTSSIPDLVPAAFYSMLAGIISALVAAIPGFVDFSDIRKDHPAKKVGMAHMILNLIAVGIYAVNLGLRAPGLGKAEVGVGPFVLSLIGIGILSGSGYLGGHMVYDDGIGVGRHRRWSTLPDETLRFSTAHLKPNPFGTVFVEVAHSDRLKEGETLRVEIDGQVIAVARQSGSLYAFQEFCTHRYGPLSEGALRNGQVQCPWHGSCFDMRTGKIISGPAKVALKTFPVELREGKICIGLQTAQAQQKAAA